MATPAWISLGSNLGDRRAILDAALAALGETPGVAVARSAPTARRPRSAARPARGRSSTPPPSWRRRSTRSTSSTPRRPSSAVRPGPEPSAGASGPSTSTSSSSGPPSSTPGPAAPAPQARPPPVRPRPARRDRPGPDRPCRPADDRRLLANLDRRPRLVALDGPTGSAARHPSSGAWSKSCPQSAVARTTSSPARSAARTVPELPRKRRPEARGRSIADRWEIATLAGSWVVADYHLETELVRFAMGTPRSSDTREDPKATSRAFDRS